MLVIEGTDGSGKTTQLGLVVEEYKRLGLPVATFDFPQYEKTFFGKFTGRFLSGEFGGLSEINPYLATLSYALDRWQAGPSIVGYLNQGKTVFCNRYVGSNMAHQAAKLLPEKQDDFLSWEMELEYKIFGVPKEDLVVFLHVAPEISAKLLEKRQAKNHLNGKQKDIAEENLIHQKETEKVYLSLVKKFPHWEMIECVKDGQIRGIDDIHRELMTIFRQKGILS